MYTIKKLHNYPELAEKAALWFSQKWRVPYEMYLESINACLLGEKQVPQWYVVLHEGEIIAGLGAIENDFHNRTDLTPNVCGVYVEDAYRKQGIAGLMLNSVCEDYAVMGISTLYLLTGHDSFYERYDWEFYCMVQGDGEAEMSRMYRHQQ